MSNEKPLVVFDILGTLGCTTSCSKTGTPGLALGPGVKDTLEELSANFRLDLLPVRDEVGEEDLRALLDDAGLEASFRHDRPRALPLATRTHLAITETRAACYVSANASRRAAATREGILVAPHCALVPDVMAGERLVYVRMTGEAPLVDALEPDSRFRPLHSDKRVGHGAEFALYAVGPVGAMTERMTILEGTDVSTDNLFFCSDTTRNPGGAEFFERLEKSSLFFERTARGAVFALGCTIPLETLSPPTTCDTLLTDLLPRLDISACCEFPPWCRDLAFSVEERDILTGLSPALIEECLGPWWRERGALPNLEKTRVESRRVFHGHNPLVVEVAAALLTQCCPTAKVWFEDFPYRGAVRRNVVAELPPDSGSPFKNEVVILSAHLDSKSNEDAAEGEAPGVDDDASGIAGVLAAAFVLSAMPRRPLRAIRFVLFNAEEEGQIGSREYARCHAADKTRRIVGVLQLDMIGGRHDYPSRRVEIHSGAQRLFAKPEVTVEAALLAELVERAMETLSDGRLIVERCPNSKSPDDPAVLESDNVRFLSECIPACLICEDMHHECTSEVLSTTIHTTNDLHVDCIYAADIARGAAGAAWLRANAPLP